MIVLRINSAFFSCCLRNHIFFPLNQSPNIIIIIYTTVTIEYTPLYILLSLLHLIINKNNKTKKHFTVSPNFSSTSQNNHKILFLSFYWRTKNPHRIVQSSLEIQNTKEILLSESFSIKKKCFWVFCKDNRGSRLQGVNNS